MHKKYILFFFSFYFFTNLFAQETENKSFKVVFLSKPLAGAIILNKTQNAFKISNEKGIADLTVQLGDSIEFSHSSTENLVLFMDNFFINEDTIDIQMRQRVVALEEVEIRDVDEANILLGVDNAGKAKLTESEREINAKTKVAPMGRTDGMVGGKINVDFVYNWISGKSKDAKKRRSLELKQESFEYLQVNFEDYFTNILRFDSGQMNRLFEAALYDKQVHDWISHRNNQALKIYLIDLSETMSAETESVE